MADSSDIDQAIINRLQGDATLASLMQPGAFVFFGESKAGSTRFVIVSLLHQLDGQTFDGRSVEDALYLVEARMLASAGGDDRAAAQRIDALLNDQPLTIEGYALMTMHREERIRLPEPDAIDPSILWNRRGGRYRVVVST